MNYYTFHLTHLFAFISKISFPPLLHLSSITFTFTYLKATNNAHKVAGFIYCSASDLCYVCLSGSLHDWWLIEFFSSHLLIGLLTC